MDTVYPPKKRALFDYNREQARKTHGGETQYRMEKNSNGQSFYHSKHKADHHDVESGMRPRSDSLHSSNSHYSETSSLSSASRETSPVTITGFLDHETPERNSLHVISGLKTEIQKPLFTPNTSDNDIFRPMISKSLFPLSAVNLISTESTDGVRSQLSDDDKPEKESHRNGDSSSNVLSESLYPYRSENYDNDYSENLNNGKGSESIVCHYEQENVDIDGKEVKFADSKMSPYDSDLVNDIPHQNKPFQNSPIPSNEIISGNYQKLSNVNQEYTGKDNVNCDMEHTDDVKKSSDDTQGLKQTFIDDQRAEGTGNKSQVFHLNQLLSSTKMTDVSLVDESSTATFSKVLSDVTNSVKDKKRPLDRNSNVNEIYKCSVCNKEFRQSGNFHSHMQLHLGSNRNCKCGVCGLDFNDSNSLQSHMRSKHTGSHPYKCEHCNREFNQFNNLRRHLRVHRDKTFKCNLCDRVFNEEFYLKMHMGTHTGHRVYSCGVCNASFPSSHELKAHVQTHSPSELHVCDICGKAFSKACVLRQHKKAHSGDRPHKCTACAKTFIHRHHLTMHMRSHTESKQFSCTICNKEFSQTSHLYKHLKQHEEENAENLSSIDFQKMNNRMETKVQKTSNGMKTEAKNISKRTEIEGKQGKPFGRVGDFIENNRKDAMNPNQQNFGHSVGNSVEGDENMFLDKENKGPLHVSKRVLEIENKRPLHVSNGGSEVENKRKRRRTQRQKKGNNFQVDPVATQFYHQPAHSNSSLATESPSTVSSLARLPPFTSVAANLKTSIPHWQTPNLHTLPGYHVPQYNQAYQSLNYGGNQLSYDQRYFAYNAQMQAYYNMIYYNSKASLQSQHRNPEVIGNYVHATSGSENISNNSQDIRSPQLNSSGESAQRVEHFVYEGNKRPNGSLDRSRTSHSQDTQSKELVDRSDINCQLLSRDRTIDNTDPSYRQGGKNDRNRTDDGQSQDISNRMPSFKYQTSGTSEHLLKLVDLRDKVIPENASHISEGTVSKLYNSDEGSRISLDQPIVAMVDRGDHTRNPSGPVLMRNDISILNAPISLAGKGMKLLTAEPIYTSHEDRPFYDNNKSNSKAENNSTKGHVSRLDTGAAEDDVNHVEGSSRKETVKETINGEIEEIKQCTGNTSEELKSYNQKSCKRIPVRRNIMLDVHSSKNRDISESLPDDAKVLNVDKGEQSLTEDRHNSDENDQSNECAPLSSTSSQPRTVTHHVNMTGNPAIEDYVSCDTCKAHYSSKAELKNHFLKNSECFSKVCQCSNISENLGWQLLDCYLSSLSVTKETEPVKKETQHVSGEQKDDLDNMQKNVVQTDCVADLSKGEYVEVIGDENMKMLLDNSLHDAQQSTTDSRNVKIAIVQSDNDMSEGLKIQNDTGHATNLENENIVQEHLDHIFFRMAKTAERLPTSETNGDKIERDTNHNLTSENEITDQENLDPIALRKAKTPQSFGLSVGNRNTVLRDSNHKLTVNCRDLEQLKRYTTKGRLSQVNGNHSKDSEEIARNKENLNMDAENSENVNTVTDMNTCEFCGENFDLVEDLQNHIKIHSSDRPYSCKICYRDFTHRHNLKRHMMSHSDNSVQCGLCSRTFKESFYLKMHMKVHAQENCRKCEICGQLVAKTEMPAHVDTHIKPIEENPTYAQIAGRVKEILNENNVALDLTKKDGYSKKTLMKMNVAQLKKLMVKDNDNETKTEIC